MFKVIWQEAASQSCHPLLRRMHSSVACDGYVTMDRHMPSPPHNCPFPCGRTCLYLYLKVFHFGRVTLFGMLQSLLCNCAKCGWGPTPGLTGAAYNAPRPSSRIMRPLTPCTHRPLLLFGKSNPARAPRSLSLLCLQVPNK